MKTNKSIIAIVSVFILTCLIYFPPVNAANTNVILVKTSQELFTALRNANPGDEIVVAEGFYEGKLGSSASGDGSSFFYSNRSGTEQNPIILRSENPNNKSTLSGSRMSGTVLRIIGNYWIIKDFKVTYAQKGIVLDSSNYSKIINCDVYNTGNEAIHLRDNSSYNVVDGCTVSDTGIQTAGYGEGIYVGSALSSWGTYGENCNYNTIQNCILGPNITAEHIDIKEGTIGTVVKNCTMNAIGISGQNYADSFIDVKGNNAVITGNTCYQNNNAVIVDAFQVHSQLTGWGINNEISGNTVHFNNTTAYVINAVNNASAMTSGNTRMPVGNMNAGNVTILTSNPENPTEPTNPTDPTNPTEPTNPTDPVNPTEPTNPTDPVNPTEPSEPENPVAADTYNNNAIYVKGDVVIYQGKTYVAKWWTQGAAPNPNDLWGVWQLQ